MGLKASMLAVLEQYSLVLYGFSSLNKCCKKVNRLKELLKHPLHYTRLKYS